MTGEVQRMEFCVPLAHAAAHDEHARTPTRETVTRLKGELLLPETARGIVIFVAASDCAKFAHHGNAIDQFQNHALGTLVIDLLEAGTGRFADASMHLPLLTEHLLAVIAQLTRLMEGEAIPPLPIVLFAAGDATPVAIRAAAVRDRAIGALACLGGFVDLAGLQYLRELKAPLQMLLGPDDGAAAANLARARAHMQGRIVTQALPAGREMMSEKTAELAAGWFGRCLGERRSQGEARRPARSPQWRM